MGDEVMQHCTNCKRDIAAQNFVIHSAYCERQIQLCPRCDEPVQRNCLKQHNEDSHATISCTYCDAEIEKWTLHKHTMVCFRRPVSCTFCDIEKPFNELSEHIELCGARTDKCSICKQFVLLRDSQKHREICQYPQKNFESYNIPQYKDVVNEASRSAITSRIGSEAGAISKLQKNFEKKNFSRYKEVNEASYSTTSDEKIGEVGAISKTVCSRKFAVCQYCNVEKPFDELSEHMEVCGARTDKCSICKQFVLLRQFENHKVLCQKQQKHFEKSNFSRYKEKANEASYSIVSGKRSGIEVGAIAKTTSSYMGVCHICKRNIPWVDMNTHIPSCATFNNKCSRCGEEVDSEKLKDHMLRLCPALSCSKSGHTARIPLQKDSSSRSSVFRESNKNAAGSRESNKSDNAASHEKACPSCKNQYPKKFLVDHMLSCQEYKCSYCLEVLPKSEKNVHEKYCQYQMENHANESKELQGTSWAEVSSSKSSRNSQIKIEDISEEITEEQCPYCVTLIPKVRYENHLMFCSERETKCHFCNAYISISNEESHLRNCKVLHLGVEKEKSYAAADLPSYDEAVRGCNGKGRGRNPADNFKQQTKSTCCSASPCKKDTKLCKFCGKSIPKCEEKGHLEVCAFEEHNRSHKIIHSANDELVRRGSKNSGAISKYSKISSKVESSPEKCPYCNKLFNAALEPYHIEKCMRNMGECALCNTGVALSNFEKHLKNDCPKYKDDEKWSKVGSKKKGKNKSSKDFSPPLKGKNIWDFFKKFSLDFGMSSAYNPGMNSPRVYDADPNSTSVYENSASEIKLPCEFCENLVPMELLVEHQSGCRPDLVHYPPPPEMQNVTKASNLLETNLLDENSFSAQKEFHLTERRGKFNRKLSSPFDTDAVPGSFLEEYTCEEEKDQYYGEEGNVFNFVANNSSKNLKKQRNKNVVEILPTKDISPSDDDFEFSKSEFPLFSPSATGVNLRIENIEKESKFPLNVDESDEEKGIKIDFSKPEFPNPLSSPSDTSVNLRIENIIEKESNFSCNVGKSDEDKNMKYQKFSNQSKIVDFSSSDESIDEENIDAYLSFLDKKDEVQSVSNAEIESHIYHFEKSLSASCIPGSLPNILKDKKNFELKNNADHISRNCSVNAAPCDNNMLLSDDDELEDDHDKYTAPVKNEMHKEVREFLQEINCELRRIKTTEVYHKWRSAKPMMESKSPSSSSSSSDID